MDKPAPTGKVWAPIAMKRRLVFACLWLLPLPLITAVIWYDPGTLTPASEQWLRLWPLWLGLVSAAVVTLLRKRRLVETPAAQAERQAKEAEQRRKSEELEERWWYRYGLAGLFVAGAWFIGTSKPHLWWVAGLMVLLAAFQARELSKLLLGLGVLVGAFALLGMLPVPVAIVLGAAIIAYGIYRQRHPEVDHKIPVVGKWLAARAAHKQQEELLKHPYFATASAAIRAYWTENADMRAVVNDSLLQSTAQEFEQEVFAIAQSESPAMENRRRLAAAVKEAAKIQVIIMDPPPVQDATGIRGQLGISGELKAHAARLAQVNSDLKEWLYGFGAPTDAAVIVDRLLLRYWVVLARANLLGALRQPLDDTHPIQEMDWYKPYLVAMCAVYEDRYRGELGLPPTLPREDGWVGLEAVKYSLFDNSVLSGAKYPDLHWREVCRKVETGEMGQEEAFA